jgi:mono/diheme cytochrome c family protein
MRHVFFWLCAATILLPLTPSLSLADGYIFRDGYYWLGSSPYTRTQSKVYTSPHCYYYKTSYAKADYTPPVYVAPKVEIPYKPAEVYVPPTPQKGWRDKLLELKQAQLEFEQKQSAAERDHKEYLEAIEALGLGDKLEPSYSGYKISKLQTAYGANAQQGNTAYGYSLSSVADVYGQNDVSVWMQQYGRAQTAAQNAADRGLDGMLQAINLEGDNRSRVATILAKAQLLSALDVPETTTQTTLEVQQSSTAGQQTPVVDALAQAVGGDLDGMLKQRCYNCHSPQGANGVSGKSELFPNGVDLTQYAVFTLPQKKRTVESVLSGEMPKNGNGLSVEETGLLYADLLNMVRTQKPSAKNSE